MEPAAEVLHAVDPRFAADPQPFQNRPQLGWDRPAFAAPQLPARPVEDPQVVLQLMGKYNVQPVDVIEISAAAQATLATKYGSLRQIAQEGIQKLKQPHRLVPANEESATTGSYIDLMV